MTPMTPALDALADYTCETTTMIGRRHDVYRIGSGPAVIVLTEMPGITPRVADFGRRVAARGMTALLPDLFGTPGKPVSNGYLASSMARACINREFHVFATKKTSPVVAWLRALAEQEHRRCGGPGVAVVGMCFTGGFALAMAVDPVVVAPVMSQPGLPVGLTGMARGSLGLDPADLVAVKQRTDDGMCVMGLRFTSDRLSPPERFATLRRELGDAFIAVEIDSSPGNPWGYPKDAHSVLTEHYSDASGSPTREAMADVLDFCATRLQVAGA